jgi:hypothetical protein
MVAACLGKQKRLTQFSQRKSGTHELERASHSRVSDQFAKPK